MLQDRGRDALRGRLIGFNRACLAEACLRVCVQASRRMFVCTHRVSRMFSPFLKALL